MSFTWDPKLIMINYQLFFLDINDHQNPNYRSLSVDSRNMESGFCLFSMGGGGGV